MTFLVIALIFNVWIWKLVSYSPLLALITIVSSVALFFVFNGGKKYSKYIFFVSFILLLIFQTTMTKYESLTLLNNDQIRIKDMRLKSYPPVYLTFDTKTLWIPAAHWFEERKESIAFFRIQKNVSETLDLNLYFFANHPRERVGYNEFEKFSYIFIPAFLAGVFNLFGGSYRKYLYFSIISPIVLISVIGNNCVLGPFSLFPFFINSIGNGLKTGNDLLRRKNK